MIQYKFNLLGSFPEEDYKKIADRALAAARRASAVDTGAYRRSWRVRLVGDFLFVFSNLRYAAPVELGSPVHKVHKHKVRNALARIGLGTGTVSLGQGVETTISSAPSSAPGTPRAEAPGTPRAAAARPNIAPLTLQEIRSPALIRNRFTLPNIPRPQRQNRAALLAALAALAAAQEEEQEQP